MVFEISECRKEFCGKWTDVRGNCIQLARPPEGRFKIMLTLLCLSCVRTELNVAYMIFDSLSV